MCYRFFVEKITMFGVGCYIDYFARLVSNSDIAVSSYVEQNNETEEVDIEKLNARIAEIVTDLVGGVA
jgi:predicted transcriptional regulator